MIHRKEEYTRRRHDDAIARRSLALNLHGLEIYETRCEFFHRDTGVLAPGKLESDRAPSGLTPEERSYLYDDWQRTMPPNYWILEILALRQELKKTRALLGKYIRIRDRFAEDDVQTENYKSYFTPEEYALLEEVQNEW